MHYKLPTLLHYKLPTLLRCKLPTLLRYKLRDYLTILMRLIFMGTPEAAVPTLHRLIEDNHEIVAVWTQPDRPAGRGGRLASPPVKDFAIRYGLAVYQPAKVKTDEAVRLFAAHNADAAVVVAYGRILPAALLHAPPQGCINVHFSLLPKYRGAAPVNWAIAKGETETGVTTMLMDEGLDTGPVLLQRSTHINDEESATELMRRLALLGADLLSDTLRRLTEITPQPQPNQDATLAPLMRREDGHIDWSQDAFAIERRVRAFQPWPNAYTQHNARRLVIWRSLAQKQEEIDGAAVDSATTAAAAVAGQQAQHAAHSWQVGEVTDARADNLIVACGDHTALRLIEVQPEGRRRMSAADFLNGTHLRAGERFG